MSNTKTTAQRGYTCPSCKKKFTEKLKAFPFCCERCKLQDLWGWTSGHYALPSQEPLSESEMEKVFEEQNYRFDK
jgi:endogenous inhibitor of DNA gyrase (YacG/DUF329 family)